ncbi:MULTISPECIES: hypothetical protein [Acinetobacter]|jgi:hypothetical protein|uniref:Lipoprotein n=1 Tax=Acinetobacter entericus TaxID=2989714 RepID=A0ABT3NHR1_9GAMM|nr:MULTISPECIES: hypothetical protein [Acinetobacter]MCW8039085.1 hypothetical protein [Acinetobacter entericus]TCB73730.1 hypothetical protein E0H91_12320 [Acinetobacter sp. ANC 4177]
MKIITIPFTLFSLCLMACQPQKPSAVAQQQNFICSALIEGFLKSQKLTHYQLWKVQPTLYNTASQRLYIYQAQGSNNMNILPQQQKLRFACEQLSARQFQLKLSDPQHENAIAQLSIELPEPMQLKALTAFSLPSEQSVQPE